MENGSKFNWLAKTTLITSSLLLLVSPSTDMAWANEMPSFQTQNLPLLLDAQPQEANSSVSQLADVHPHDWAFQAWKSLAEKYDCSSAHINLSQLENRPLSRSEFAVDLNTCLNQFLAHLDKTESRVSIDDVRLWQRLQADFAVELSFLGKSTNDLDIRVQQLEKVNFSSTTKLKGEVLFLLADSFGDSIDSDRDESQTFFGSRLRLNLVTSFSGRDSLKTKLKTTDIGRLNRVTGTVMTRLGTDGEDEGEVELEANYSFPLGDRTLVSLGTSGAGVNKAAETLNPLSSSGKGAASRFGRRDPITLRSSGSAGIAIQHQFSDFLQGNIGYSTSASNATSPQKGLFSGSYNAVAQLVAEPNDNLELAFTYTRKYQSEDKVNLMSSTGSENANRPFGENATSADNWGVQFNWHVTDGFDFGGWFGYAQAQQQQGGQAEATIIDGALNFTFPDLGKEGNLGGIIIGVPPIVTNHEDPAFEDETTAWHLEALYRIEVNDHFDVIPDVFLITNPNHEHHHPIWVGTIRSRFSF